MTGITNTPPQLSTPLTGAASSGAAPIGMLDETSAITEIEDAEIDSPTLNLKPNNPAEQLVPLKMPATLPSGGSFQVSQTQVTADIYDFMQVFQQVAQQMRSSARVQRTSEMQAQVTSLQGAAQEMRAAAAERFKAALTQAITQIVSGAVQVGMAGFSAFKSAQGMKADSAKAAESSSANSSTAKAGDSTTMRLDNFLDDAPTMKLNDFLHEPQSMRLDNFLDDTPPMKLSEFLGESAAQPTQINTAAVVGKLVSDSIQGTASIINGIGAIPAAIFTQRAAEMDANKANLETEAKMHENAQQQANETMQQMMDVIRDVREKLQSIEQANLETSRSIARNI